MKNLITTNDPKVVEFLKYLGVDLSLTRNVVITVPLDGAVIVEETRIAEKPEE